MAMDVNYTYCGIILQYTQIPNPVGLKMCSNLDQFYKYKEGLCSLFSQGSPVKT